MTNELVKNIDTSRLPKHVAIIMDGNGRWAKKGLLPRKMGHKAGVERVKEIVRVAGNLGIEHLTLFAFSTENWVRPKDEVSSLMKLLIYYLRSELDTIHKNDVKIQVIGDLSRIPSLQKEEALRAMELTKNNKRMVLNIALNYGGRLDIVQAAKQFAKDVQENKISIEELDEKKFSNYLYTSNQPDPDLLIRPSGELRISNFLLYQIAYTEFWFSNIYWPDFNEEHFYKAIIDFQQRDRRYGGVKDDE